jgi:hypothetical protein
MAGAFSDGRSGLASTAELAAHELRQAERQARRRAVDMREAERAREDGERLLQAPTHLIGDASLELVPAPAASEALSHERRHVLNTLEEPNVISVDASEHRARPPRPASSRRR